jgi:pilus assembly protein CpaE
MSNVLAMRESSPDSGHSEGSFTVFTQDDSARRVLSGLAERPDWAGADVLDGTIATAIETASELPAAGHVVVDLDASPDAAAMVARLRRSCAAGTNIIALGEINDVAYYCSLIEAGASDYLVKPLAAETLEAALGRATAAASPREDAAPAGRLVTFIGARGGVGASTIALNTAWVMAEEAGRRTVLLDLDLHFGASAINLDVEPGRGLREALENPDRIDALFLSSAIAAKTDRLHVLTAEEPLEDGAVPDPDALARLIAELRGAFDCVVVDLPRHAAHTFAAALEDADEIVVVSDLTLVGVRDTARLLAMAGDASPEAGVRIAVNRAGGRDGQITRREFERGIERPIDFAIPADAKLAANAANAGRPLAEILPRARMLKPVRTLAEMVAPPDPADTAAPKRRLRLWGT